MPNASVVQPADEVVVLVVFHSMRSRLHAAQTQAGKGQASGASCHLFDMQHMYMHISDRRPTHEHNGNNIPHTPARSARSRSAELAAPD